MRNDKWKIVFLKPYYQKRLKESPPPPGSSALPPRHDSLARECAAGCDYETIVAGLGWVSQRGQINGWVGSVIYEVGFGWEDC